MSKNLIRSAAVLMLLVAFLAIKIYSTRPESTFPFEGKQESTCTTAFETDSSDTSFHVEKTDEQTCTTAETKNNTNKRS